MHRINVILTSFLFLCFPRSELALQGIKYLNLERNRLTSVDGAFNLLRSLQVLELARNRISSLTPSSFLGMDSLISLDVSDNLIDDIPAGAFRNQYLNEVNASGNLLEELRSGAFSGLSILEVVDLGRNRIGAIGDGAFENVPRLKVRKVV